MLDTLARAEKEGNYSHSAAVLPKNRANDGREAFLASVQAGLSRKQKTLECKYLYDERGSELFDQICDLPEYYPTRTEIGILRECLAAVAERLGEGVEIVELGSGASIKTRILLTALKRPSRYVPIDISEEFLLGVAAGLRADYPGLSIEPVVGDFMEPLALPPKSTKHRLLFFPGSTIGNLHRSEAGTFLQDLRVGTSADRFLIGVDLKKDKATLEAAYDDAAGVTAEFNLNMLRRINRELDATFDLGEFQHRAVYNNVLGRVEMHMVSLAKQTVRVHDQYFTFLNGETIHSENSYKYGIEEFKTLAEKSGWLQEALWTDTESRFAVYLLKAV